MNIYLFIASLLVSYTIGVIIGWKGGRSYQRVVAYHDFRLGKTPTK